MIKFKQLRYSKIVTALQSLYFQGLAAIFVQTQTLVAIKRQSRPYPSESGSKIQNGETVSVENAAQMATLTKVGYADYQTAGPISITEGRMTYNTYWGSEDKEVYVVALSGPETIVENQTTTVKEDNNG